jgi:hypothetical protein
MKNISSIVLFILLLTCSCSKDGKLYSTTSLKTNLGDTLTCTTGIEIAQYYIHNCGGDSTGVGMLLQLNDSPAVGIHSKINGTMYNNIVLISFYPDSLETIPDSLRKTGKKLYFNYCIPVRPEIWNGPCIAAYPPMENYPLIYISNLSSVQCL